jgi:Uma2 family endonuclease
VTNLVYFSPLLRRYSLEEFWELPDREDHARYDLIAGILFMVPRPEHPHGDIAARMNRALFAFLIKNEINDNVYHPRAPILRRGKDATYLTPDMMYVTQSLRAQMGGYCTSADIVFEFLSEDTSIYDRTTKADTYLALGVRELWLIDPVTMTIEVRQAHNNADIPRWETWIYTQGEHAKSHVLDGWEVSVSDFFNGIV